VFGAGWHRFGAMLLWALSIRKADGGSPDGRGDLSSNDAPSTTTTFWMRQPSQPNIVQDRRVPLSNVTRPVAMRVDTIRTIAHIHHNPPASPSEESTPAGSTDRRKAFAAQRSPNQPPVSVAELLVTRHFRTTSHPRQLPVHLPGAIGRNVAPVAHPTILPGLAATEPMRVDRTNIGDTGSRTTAAASLPPHLAADVRLDGARPTGPTTFRRSVAGELAGLVETITRTIEQRIEQRVQPSPVSPPVVALPHAPNAEETYLLAQAEQRERAFRMGRQ
jgi:hypothetical protein